MEIFTTVIENTNTPETQEILKTLDNTRDVLLTGENPENPDIFDVQYIKPINQIKTIGTIPTSLMAEIKDKCGENIIPEISDYEVTYDNGVYGLAVDLKINDSLPSEVAKGKSLPLPLLIVVGALTGILTVVLIIIKLIKKHKK